MGIIVVIGVFHSYLYASLPVVPCLPGIRLLQLFENVINCSNYLSDICRYLETISYLESSEISDLVWKVDPHTSDLDIST